jgi:hypothetical protein
MINGSRDRSEKERDETSRTAWDTELTDLVEARKILVALTARRAGRRWTRARRDVHEFTRYQSEAR